LFGRQGPSDNSSLLWLASCSSDVERIRRCRASYILRLVALAFSNSVFGSWPNFLWCCLQLIENARRSIKELAMGSSKPWIFKVNIAYVVLLQPVILSRDDHFFDAIVVQNDSRCHARRWPIRKPASNGEASATYGRFKSRHWSGTCNSQWHYFKSIPRVQIIKYRNKKLTSVFIIPALNLPLNGLLRTIRLPGSGRRLNKDQHGLVIKDYLS